MQIGSSGAVFTRNKGPSCAVPVVRRSACFVGHKLSKTSPSTGIKPISCSLQPQKTPSNQRQRLAYLQNAVHSRALGKAGKASPGSARSLDQRSSGRQRLAIHASQLQSSQHISALKTTPETRFKLAVKDLQRLGELPDDTIYAAGIVSSPEQLAEYLDTSLTEGLTTEEDFTERAEQLGVNSLPAAQVVSFWELAWNALQDFTVLILLASGILSVVLSLTIDRDNPTGWIEGAAILVAVGLVVVVAAVSDYQKEQQFRELNAVKDNVQVTVLRDSKTTQIGTQDLLVGDVLCVETGDILPADGVLFEGSALKVDESHLTGEADDCVKNCSTQPMMLSGSKVLEGFGRMVVTSVGTNSQQGVISTLVSGPRATSQDFDDADGLREETQLEKKLQVMAADIGKFGLSAALVSLTAMAGQFSWDQFVVQGNTWAWSYLQDYLHMLITSITILVVAVPEGLPLAVTIALAYSVKRMLADNNLVRHLGAAETMGCATTICTDKTGTLTANDMAVVRLWVGGQEFDGLHNLGDSAGAPARADFIIEEADAAAAPLLEPVGIVTSESGAGPDRSFIEPVSLMSADDLRAGMHSGNPRDASPLGLDPRVLDVLCRGISLNSTASLRVNPETRETLKIGNRTECALLQLAADLGADTTDIRRTHETLRQFPFSSDRKRMSSLTTYEGSNMGGVMCARLFVKGAAELVLELCNMRIGPDSSVRELEAEEKTQLLDSFSRDGHRMLALAYRDVMIPYQSELNADEFDPLALESQLTLVALVGIQDPLRAAVPGAITQCKRAGITVRMLTGDNAVTARSIAAECGILHPVDHSSNGNGASPPQADADVGSVLEGSEFRRRVVREDGSINQAEFEAIWSRMRVLARCSPKDKYIIVKALQANPNEIVAMTGDGTNDAPALRNADVGFAMNSGTSIAKEAADIILMDDNFNSIVNAVKWGRNVYAGITKFLQFQLTINVVAVVTACAGAVALRESPLTAVQMLWVNLIMDSLASLSLATESPTDDMLDLPPYTSDQSLIPPAAIKQIVGQAIFQLAVMFGLVGYGDVLFNVPAHLDVLGPSEHYTIVFNAFVLMQLFNQINARKINDERSVLSGVLDNQLFTGIVLSELLLQVVIVQFGGEAFSTHPLSLSQWGACLGIGALSLLVRQLLVLLPTPSLGLSRPAHSASSRSQ